MKTNAKEMAKLVKAVLKNDRLPLWLQHRNLWINYNKKSVSVKVYYNPDYDDTLLTAVKQLMFVNGYATNDYKIKTYTVFNRVSLIINIPLRSTQ